MLRDTLLLLFLFWLTNVQNIQAGSIAIDGLLPYKCEATRCLNGACSTGACTCEADYYGPECIPVNEGVTCPSCVAQNTAVHSGSPACSDQDVCICLEGYSGNSCADLRVLVDCTNLQMSVTIFPYPSNANEAATGFTGGLYLSDTDTFDLTTSCSFTTTSTTAQTFDAILYDGTQTGDCVGLTPAVDGELKSLYVYHQYRQGIQMNLDQIHTVQCDLSGAVISGQLAATQSVTPLDTTDTATRLQSTYFESPEGLSMSLLGPAYVVLTEAVDVGSDLFLILEHNQQYTLKECIAYSYDTTGSDSGTQLTLISDWCVPFEAEPLFVAATTFHDTDGSSNGGSDDSLKMTKVSLRAWWFVGGTNDIFIECEACIGFGCQTGATAPTCDNDLMDSALTDTWLASRRKRRDLISTNSDNTTRLVVSISINNPNLPDGDDAADGDGSQISAAQCFQQLTVLLPLCLLAGLMFFAMAMAIYFCSRLLVDQRRTDGKTC